MSMTFAGYTDPYASFATDNSVDTIRFKKLAKQNKKLKKRIKELRHNASENAKQYDDTQRIEEARRMDAMRAEEARKEQEAQKAKKAFWGTIKEIATFLIPLIPPVVKSILGFFFKKKQYA